MSDIAFPSNLGTSKTTHMSIHPSSTNRVIFLCPISYVDYVEGDSDGTLVERFKDKVLSKGFTILYQTAEEQSFHPLPEEEQELLNNLETYYGVTNLYNDQGCPMWLTYVQDTKAAIDNKFNNIRQAVLSLGGNV